jgi:hypothetical protein
MLFAAIIARDGEQSDCRENRISNGRHSPDMNVTAILPTEIYVTHLFTRDNALNCDNIFAIRGANMPSPTAISFPFLQFDKFAFLSPNNVLNKTL